MAYSDRTEQYLQQKEWRVCPRAARLRDRMAGIGGFLRDEQHQAEAVAYLDALDRMIDHGQEASDADEAVVEAALTSWGAGKFPRRNQ